MIIVIYILVIVNLVFTLSYDSWPIKPLTRLWFPEISSKMRLYNQKISSSTDKIRVKLLQDTPQGKKNEIVMVSKALWSNLIEPKKQGIRISDEEMIKIQQQAIDSANQELKLMQDFSEKISSSRMITPISKKVGANGQLFGSVNHKSITDHIKVCIPGYDKLVENKSFQVISIWEYGNDEKGLQILSKSESLSEIRRAGKYRIKVRVHPKLEEVEFDLKVGL